MYELPSAITVFPILVKLLSNPVVERYTLTLLSFSPIFFVQVTVILLLLASTAFKVGGVKDSVLSKAPISGAVPIG